MANNKNLKPWPKGTSGNPKGRPKGSKNFSTILRQMLQDETLAEHLEDFVGDMPPSYANYVERKDAAHLMMATLVRDAVRGSYAAIDKIMKIGRLEELEGMSPNENEEPQDEKSD